MLHSGRRRGVWDACVLTNLRFAIRVKPYPSLTFLVLSFKAFFFLNLQIKLNSVLPQSVFFSISGTELQGTQQRGILGYPFFAQNTCSLDDEPHISLVIINQKSSYTTKSQLGINNGTGNKTEWSPIQSIIIYVFIPINPKNYNFPEKNNSQVMKER